MRQPAGRWSAPHRAIMVRFLVHGRLISPNGSPGMFRFRYCFQIKFRTKKMKMAMRVLVVNKMSPKSMAFSFFVA
jgi:hypothetical protein